jgi:hypothetical protein
MGNYDYDRIAVIAIKRYVEGYDTIALLDAARSQREKEEIILVALLHFDDDVLADFNLGCGGDDECQTITCRNRLKHMLRGYLEHGCYH